MTAARLSGLEWLGEDIGDEHEASDDPDEDRGDTPLYLTMPTLEGLRKILSLWKRYAAGEAKPADARQWWSLFGYLRDVRPWSAKDRVDPALGAYVERMLAEYPTRPVRLELDLWFRDNADLRAEAREYVAALMETLGGEVLDFATIEPIRYQAALVELPGRRAQALGALRGPLADADRVMRVRPQSLYRADPGEPLKRGRTIPVAPGVDPSRPAVAALIDGYPVQNHDVLAGRLEIEEVDVTGADVPVSRRFHGTTMASLIVRGDLDGDGAGSDRPLKVVPILAAPQSANAECTPPDRLPIDLVYRAVTALVEGLDGQAPRGEHVVVINHSVCDAEAPFARRASYWAKLLDYLSFEHRLLFVVSAGNCAEPFLLDAYDDCDAFEAADAIERQIVLLRSFERSKGTRLILSPAESINSLTVGAVHADGGEGAPDGEIDPYAAVGVTNLASTVGLGVNRGLKPDLVESGGRQLVRTDTDQDGVSAWARLHPDVGQLTAMPDPSGGTTHRVGRSSGTSNAAALVTRSAIRLADVVESLFSETGEDWTEAPTRAVMLKALLAHGCAWGDAGTLMNATYPGNWQRRREAVTRVIGYGRADPSRVVSMDGSRITLLADDLISDGALHEYRLPIPRAMLGNKDLRRITMTLAWASPIDPVTQRYRGVLVELIDDAGKRDFWDGVGKTLQPTVFAGRRGTLQHIILEGEKKRSAVAGGGVFVGVQARGDLAAFKKTDVPYALAITLEMAQPIRQDLFEDVRTRIRAKRVAVPVPTRIPTRVRP